MENLLKIGDFVVLLLLVIQLPRIVRKKQPEGSGSLLLSIVIALAVIVFGAVSFSAFTRLLA
jgi:hypothetical protein